MSDKEVTPQIAVYEDSPEVTLAYQIGHSNTMSDKNRFEMEQTSTTSTAQVQPLCLPVRGNSGLSILLTCEAAQV